jgi:FKBP-type peptidyl-prolyl cis-trans isomerase
MVKSGLLLLLCAFVIMLSCKSSDVTPPTEKQLIKAYVDKYRKSNSVLKSTMDTDSILYVLFTKVNSNKADTLSKGKSVTINSVGKFLDGAIFDNYPQTFVLGSSTVIIGLDAGVSQMKIGEKATIIFTSIIGYGATKAYGSVNAKGRVLKGKDANGNDIIEYVNIPADTPLAFEIEVVK